MPGFVASRSGDTAPWYATGRPTERGVCAEHLFSRTSIREGTRGARANAAHWPETKTQLPACFWDGAHSPQEEHPATRPCGAHARTPCYCSELACGKGQPGRGRPALPLQSYLTVTSRPLLLLGEASVFGTKQL